MKMDAPHIVPLSKQALVVLYDLKKVAAEGAKHMFPVLGTKEGVMSENTLNKALRLLGYAGNVMTAHGFRSMASTPLNEQQSVASRCHRTTTRSRASQQGTRRLQLR